MTNPAFKGTVKDGVFSMTKMDRTVFLNYCQTLKDGEYKLSVKKGYKGVVNEQYGYLYTGIYGTISEDTGYGIAETDKQMKEMFWFEVVDLIGREGELCRVKMTRSKTEMTAKDMGDYIENIKQWWRGFKGWDLPLPKEVGYE